MKDDKLYILEKMPVPRAILSLALPTVLSMMIQILYNLTDTFFIGKLNDPYQVAAVTIALPIFMIQMAIAGIFGNGGASYISRLLGRKKIYEARETTSSAIFTSALVSVVVGIAGLLWLKQILAMMGTSGQTYGFAASYLKIILLGSPIVMLNFTLSQLIRSEGAAKTAMVGMLIGTGINIVLDPVFILILKMGVTGAAVATLIGNASAVLYYAAFYAGKKSIVPPSLKTLHLRKEIYREIFKIGIPASLSQIMMGIGSSISYKLAAQYSDHNVAALGIAMRVFTIPIYIFIGLAVGVQPLIGYSYGAKLYGRMRETLRTSIMIALGLTVLFLIVFASFPRIMISTFIVYPEVVDLGTMILGAYLFAIPFAAIGMIFMAALQAMGKALPALIVALSRQGIVYIPMIFILNYLWQFEGLIFALPIADACTVLISATFLYYILKKIPK
ncbi:MAG: MATE family efflux transporter, partial [Candidatus Cloacimonadaceae bacterium]|nr:MATE family efflux transporter [Candidatus Cloacimonadaceae bacterium]